MQSSISCIASNAQEERANNVDDEDRHHGEEEVSTISNENISAQKEKHAHTKRDAAPDSIAQLSKRRDRGRVKLIQQFPEKVCKKKQYDVVMKLFDILVTSTAFYNCALVVLVRYFTSFKTTTSPAYRS